MLLIDVVCGKALSQLGCYGADDVVAVGVVIRVATEDLDPDRSLFDLVCRSGQRLLNYVAKECNGPFACPEGVIPHQLLKLRADHLRG
jgi:hypothetical protein